MELNSGTDLNMECILRGWDELGFVLRRKPFPVFLSGFDSGFLFVGGMEVEIDAAQRTIVLGLAEDDRHLFVQRDAVPQMRPAGDIGPNGLVHQGDQGGSALFRRLVNADDVPVVALHGFDDLVLKCLDA